MPNPDPALVEQWRGMQEGFAPLAGQALADKLALFRGAYAGLVDERLIEHTLEPFISAFLFGCGDARLHAVRHGRR